jgi:hypothetical protein
MYEINLKSEQLQGLLLVMVVVGWLGRALLAFSFYHPKGKVCMKAERESK